MYGLVLQSPQAAGTHPPAKSDVAYDDRAIVHWVFEARDKNRVEQLLGHRSIKHGARLNKLIELRAPFEHNQPTDAFCGELLGSLDDLFDHLRLVRGSLPAKKRPASNTHQRATNFRLEDDDNDDDEVGHERVQQRPDRVEAQSLGGKVRHEDKNKPERHLHGACAFEQEQPAVHECANQKDIQKIERKIEERTREKVTETPRELRKPLPIST